MNNGVYLNNIKGQAFGRDLMSKDFIGFGTRNSFFLNIKNILIEIWILTKRACYSPFIIFTILFGDFFPPRSEVGSSESVIGELTRFQKSLWSCANKKESHNFLWSWFWDLVSKISEGHECDALGIRNGYKVVKFSIGDEAPIDDFGTDFSRKDNYFFPKI